MDVPYGEGNVKTRAQQATEQDSFFDNDGLRNRT